MFLSGSDADLVDCAFRDNFMGAPEEAVIAAGNGASIALHRPAFSGNFGAGLLLNYEGAVDGARAPYFTDEPFLEEYCSLNEGAQPTQPLALSDTNLAAKQSWLQRKRVVRPTRPPYMLLPLAWPVVCVICGLVVAPCSRTGAATSRLRFRQRSRCRKAPSALVQSQVQNPGRLQNCRSRYRPTA